MRLLGWFLSIYASLFVTDCIVYGDPLAAYAAPPTEPSIIGIATTMVPQPTVGLIPATICAVVFFFRLQAIGPVN